MKRKPGMKKGIWYSLFFHAGLALLLAAIPLGYLAWQRQGPPRETVGTGPSETNLPSTPAPAPPDLNDVWEEKVNDSIRTSIVESQDKSEEENREKLASLVEELEQVSSEKTIDELSQKFHGWLGTTARAGEPAREPVEGEFDFDSAQVHDVLREETPQGFSYRSILVDSAGRTFEAPLESSVGESTYQTLQLLKSSPLAEKVYRQIAMPLLDKVISAGQQAAKMQQDFQAAEAEKMKE